MPITDIPAAKAYMLRNCSVPAIFLTGTMAGRDSAIIRCDVSIAAGKISDVAPAMQGVSTQGPALDVAGAMIWPCFADVHCHLDKGQISGRATTSDGAFTSALDAVAADRVNWTKADMRARMDFGLRCAFAHGSSAVRTHLDSDHLAAPEAWEAFAELRAHWAGRIALQAVSLVQVGALADRTLASKVADRVAAYGGTLGASTRQVPELESIIEHLFLLAEERSLALDFHVDETADPGATALSLIARIAKRRRFAAKIVVGHCCSLAAQDDALIERTLDLVADAGLAVVTLPLLNLQLQDRQRGRTPRWRGMTLVHEMRARGIPVAVGGDNVRDPLHPYGDHDMLEAYRDATRIGHLDSPIGTWPTSVTSVPRAIMDLPENLIGPGHPADFILFSARSYSELLARPQSNRMVVRGGKPSRASLPDFAELDDLSAGASTVP
jgi:cytosine deaminase